jgi:hypothetical protein
MESGIISRMKSTLRSARNNHRASSALASTRHAMVGPALLCTAASGVAKRASPMAKDGSSLAVSKLHCRTVGVPIHNETGLIPNESPLLGGERKGVVGYLSERVASALFDKGPRLAASQYFLTHKDRAGAPASAISLTRHWKAMLPELLQEPERQ